MDTSEVENIIYCIIIEQLFINKLIGNDFTYTDKNPDKVESIGNTIKFGIEQLDPNQLNSNNTT